MREPEMSLLEMRAREVHREALERGIELTEQAEAAIAERMLATGCSMSRVLEEWQMMRPGLSGRQYVRQTLRKKR